MRRVGLWPTRSDSKGSVDAFSQGFKIFIFLESHFCASVEASSATGLSYHVMLNPWLSSNQHTQDLITGDFYGDKLSSTSYRTPDREGTLHSLYKFV